MGYMTTAKEWYDKHTEHVDKLRESTKLSVRPSLEDFYHPELWKNIHWNWFFEEGEDNER